MGEQEGLVKDQESILAFSHLKDVIMGGGANSGGTQTSLSNEETAWCCHEEKT